MPKASKLFMHTKENEKSNLLEIKLIILHIEGPSTEYFFTYASLFKVEVVCTCAFRLLGCPSNLFFFTGKLNVRLLRDPHWLEGVQALKFLIIVHMQLAYTIKGNTPISTVIDSITSRMGFLTLNCKFNSGI